MGEYLLTIPCEECGAPVGRHCSLGCKSDEDTRYGVAITLPCGNGHDVDLPASATDGHYPCIRVGCGSWVDVAWHARHATWCGECAGIDGEHESFCSQF